MLIRCESCGKMFDYDKQDGQCPACGAFAARPAAQAAPEAAPAPDFGPETGGLGGVRGTLRRPSAVRTAAKLPVQNSMGRGTVRSSPAMT